jgi:nitrate/nitrite-specific signal transduction histidine kinase
LDLETGQVERTIRNNGIGFDHNALSERNSDDGASVGPYALQVLAKQVEGPVQVKYGPGEGTEVNVIFRFPVIAADLV